MTQERYRKILQITKLSLLLMLGAMVLNLLLGGHRAEIFTPKGLAGAEQDGPFRPDQSVSPRPPGFARVIEENLFGGGNSPAASARAAVQAAPVGGELGLELVGAIAGSPTISRAVIRNTVDNSSGVYKVGDRIAGAVVESIASQAVVLRHDGRLKTLVLRSAGASTVRPSIRSDTQVSSQAGSAPSPSGFSPVPQQPTPLGKVEAILRQARVRPYVVDGRTQGLQISGIDKIPLARDAGLCDGDVVQVINGQTLTSQQKAFQVLMKARSRPHMTMQVLREGRARTFSFGGD